MTAVEQGVTIAEQFEATVHFLTVVDVRAEVSASTVEQITDNRTNILEKAAEDTLNKATSQAKAADVPYERSIFEGIPHDAITDYSAEHDIDLIVIGATGKSGIKENLLGSTTDRVAQSADTSVLIIRSELS